VIRFDLDTRVKIFTADEAKRQLQGRPAAWVTGHFDPLLAEHVQRLQQSTRPGKLLVVEVTNPPHPLLSQRARAELVAALAMVDYVVVSDSQPSGEGAPDSDLTGAFVKHVLARHRKEVAG
jgi:bifunctional ADP-heptose synthase (sugar kinase/adenylyltransferase)